MRSVTIHFFVFIFILTGGCSSTRRFILPHPEGDSPVSIEASEAGAADSQEVVPVELIQFQADLDEAEMILRASVEARHRDQYEEAQKHLDKVAQLLSERDVEEISDSLLVRRYDQILESLSQEYYIVFDQVSEISVSSPAWAILNRIG